jgi:site-specific recombinase XerD
MKPHLPKSQQNIVHRYQHHLREVVGLSSKTCQNQGRDIRGFLAAIPIRRVADLAGVTPAAVTNYLTVRSADYEPASLRQVAGSLRQFLRFAHQQEWTRGSLSLAVPKIASGAQHDLPVYLSEQELKSLLNSWDRSTAEGKRDRAIGLCLARLGLRAGEVAALALEDLDWRQGSLRLRRSKNGCPAELPLMSEVGAGIADYLRGGRPVCQHRQVFLRHPTATPMDGQAISRVIRRGLRHCGIALPRAGAHLLRHTLASHLVQHGATLKEVADVLRHRHLNSTGVYAHVNVDQLRPLAQPWPKEATL